ncbi:MAG: hypothetical protein HYS74_00065 [Parcubacteria group bacterium]|nr:hypothetical protein [Parcubacteria group bacterium]
MSEIHSATNGIIVARCGVTSLEAQKFAPRFLVHWGGRLVDFGDGVEGKKGAELFSRAARGEVRYASSREGGGWAENWGPGDWIPFYLISKAWHGTVWSKHDWCDAVGANLVAGFPTSLVEALLCSLRPEMPFFDADRGISCHPLTLRDWMRRAGGFLPGA